jgi:hypothetical protein
MADENMKIETFLKRHIDIILPKSVKIRIKFEMFTFVSNLFYIDDKKWSWKNFQMSQWECDIGKTISYVKQYHIVYMKILHKMG